MRYTRDWPRLIRSRRHKIYGRNFVWFLNHGQILYLSDKNYLIGVRRKNYSFFINRLTLDLNSVTTLHTEKKGNTQTHHDSCLCRTTKPWRWSTTVSNLLYTSTTPSLKVNTEKVCIQLSMLRLILSLKLS